MSLALRLIGAWAVGDTSLFGSSPERYIPATQRLIVQVEVEGVPTATDQERLKSLVGTVLWRSP